MAGIPTEWAPEKNIAWKAEVPGVGWSSPIYWNGRVYLTAAVPTEEGKANDQQLTVLALDAANGATVWSKVVFEQRHDDTSPIHGKNSHASPTPITDGRHLFVHFGTQGTACLDLDGNVVWRTQELRYEPQHGNGGSPVLTDGLLIVSCDGHDVQFVAALDQSTGKVRWKKDRPPFENTKGFSFSTPLVIEIDGQRQVISPGSDQVVAYRPTDGEELWRYRYTGYSVIPRPVFGHGLLFVSSGYDRPILHAFRPGTKAAPAEAAWTIEKAAPHTPSVLLVGDELYFVSDRGIATCVDARTGEVHWVERLGGNYSASPLYAGGHIYFQDEDGGTTVIRPGKTYEEVSRNKLPGRTLASCAVTEGSIFLRTDTHLYRIQQR